MADSEASSSPKSDGGGAVARPLLKDHAYKEIKRRILNGSLAAGGFLAERTLAAELGMSKTPIRAAIGRLETEGLLAVSPQQGIVVREPSFREIVDHFDTRVALETYVLQHLAGKLTSEQRTLLSSNLTQQRKITKAQRVFDYVSLDAAFHTMFASFLGNDEILRLVRRQYDLLFRVVLRVIQQDPNRMDASCDEHEALLEAVASGSGETAAQLMKQHVEYGKGYLVG